MIRKRLLLTIFPWVGTVFVILANLQEIIPYNWGRHSFIFSTIPSILNVIMAVVASVFVTMKMENIAKFIMPIAALLFLYLYAFTYALPTYVFHFYGLPETLAFSSLTLSSLILWSGSSKKATQVGQVPKLPIATVFSWFTASTVFLSIFASFFNSYYSNGLITLFVGLIAAGTSIASAFFITRNNKLLGMILAAIPLPFIAFKFLIEYGLFAYIFVFFLTLANLIVIILIKPRNEKELSGSGDSYSSITPTNVALNENDPNNWEIRMPGSPDQKYNSFALQNLAKLGVIKPSTPVVEISTQRTYAAKQIPGVFSEKNYVTTLLLSFFLGSLGIDRFYLGQTGLGVAKLLTLGGCGVWTLIDFIMIAARQVKDINGLPLA